jgi:hypothetical protein
MVNSNNIVKFCKYNVSTPIPTLITDFVHPAGYNVVP